jgi:hypothetical protein
MVALPAERRKINYRDRSAIPSEPPSLARLSAALASDGGGEGWPIPLVGLSIVRRLRNSNLADHGNVSSEADRWQRIDLLPVRLPLRTASQIKVAIQTNGPSMQGLIRIPGGIASNFDTGAGTTVVDLINVGNDTTGYADVVAVEVLLTRSMSNQSFQVFTVD